MSFLQRFGSALQYVLRGNGIPAAWFNRAGAGDSERVNQLSQPYANSVWVMAAVKKVAGPISAVELELYDEQDQEITDPRLEAFWRAPALNADGSRMSQADFLELVASWLCIAGEIFFIFDDSWQLPFPEVDKYGGYTPLLIGRPDRLRPNKYGQQLVSWEYTDAANRKTTLRLDQVIQIKLFNPYDDIRGLGPLQAALIAAGGDYAAGVFAKNTAEANGDQGVYIVAKTGVPDDTQREQIINQLREKRSAQQRGIFRPAFLTGDISIEDPKVRAVDVAFISQRIEARKEIAITFGVPPSFFDPVASYSIGAASDRYILIEETCKPLGGKICGGLSRVSERLRGQPVCCELDWDDHSVMQAVRRERIDAGLKLWGTGMPMEEVSDYLNLDLPEYPGWDVGYLPFSVAPIGPNGEPPQPEPAADPALAEDTTPPDAVQEALRALRSGPEPASRASNAALWRSHMLIRSKSVRLYQSKVSKLFNEYRAIALKHFYVVAGKAVGANAPVSRALIDLIFDEKSFGRDLINTLDHVSRATLDTAGKELFAEIGRKDDPWQMPPQEALDFLNSRKAGLEGVADTARGQLNTVLEQSLKDGLSTEQTASAIRGVFNDLTKGEAKRIATTEVSAAYGTARHQAMTDAGVQYKSWLSSHGPNVRAAHRQAETDYSAVPIPVDEPFRVGGEDLMYPGDPNGSPGNVINCQCVQIAVANPEENP